MKTPQPATPQTPRSGGGSAPTQTTATSSLLPRCNASAAIIFAIALLLVQQWHFAILHTTRDGGLQRHRAPGHKFLDAFVDERPPRRGSPLRRRREDGPPKSLADGGGARRQGGDSRDSPYLLSQICGECARSYFDHRPCWTIIQNDVRRSKGATSAMDAARKLGRESENCKLCDPARCREHHRLTASGDVLSKYWRFDASAPRFSRPVTLALPSIPERLRMPPSRFDDIGSYFTEKKRGEGYEGMDYLVEYNPGLVVIPESMRDDLPEEAVYLMSLRVTPANNCFSTSVYEDIPHDVWNAVYHTPTNHLGLALLDGNYDLLPGYDVVIEIDVPFDLKRDTTSDKARASEAGDAVSPTFMDYRLFVLNNEIYLHANADTVVVTRLRLRAKGYGDDDAYVRSAGTCEDVAREAGSLGKWEVPCRISNLYGGDGLQVTIMRQFNTVWSGGINGKNYALFSLPNATDPGGPESVYAEIDIFPHRVQQILPEEYDQMEKRWVFERIWKPGTHKSRRFNLDRVNMRSVRDVGNATDGGELPPPSFSTVDAHEDWFPGSEAPFKERAHGGACCVSIPSDVLNRRDGSGRVHRDDLLVGVGHTKVTWKPWYGRASVPQWQKDRVPHTHYVSLFYAFDPRPPFAVRARSGYFCLGHAPPSTADGVLPPGEGGLFNPRSVLTRSRPLLQNNFTFDCPQMSFVSSFTEKADDNSKAVIGYGLNDCTGRLVEVEKEEIASLLFPDPMDMLFEEK